MKGMIRRWLTTLAMACAPLLASAQQDALRLNELLFQPKSGEAEYVELYNAGETPVELSQYHVVRVQNDSLTTHYALPEHTVAPRSYVVLTRDAASVNTCFSVFYADRIVECRLPTYPNDGGSVVLARADSTVVDRLDYSPAMHSRLLRNRAGVALERRDALRPTNEPANWYSASSTSGYGTPGYANSQSTEWLVEEAAFEASATLLSPDGDGYQDLLEIVYRMDDGTLAARAAVYDARGQRVRRLLNNALLGAAGTISWDGRADNGSLLPQGQYVIQIVVYDVHGTQQTLRRAVALLR